MGNGSKVFSGGQELCEKIDFFPVLQFGERRSNKKGLFRGPLFFFVPFAGTTRIRFNGYFSAYDVKHPSEKESKI